MQSVQQRTRPAFDPSLIRGVEELYERILAEKNGDTPHKDFLVDYGLLVCDWRRRQLGLTTKDSVEALLEAIDLKEGVGKKLGIKDETLEAVNRLIAAKDVESLLSFSERLAKFRTKKGEE